MRHYSLLAVFILAVLFAGAVWSLPPVFPGATWASKRPAEVGLDSARLVQIQNYLGGRGCIVRYGYMVHTWGSQSQRSDVASACKPWYSHFLFKAVEDGKLTGVAEKAVDHWSCLNTLNASLGYKDRNITFRHMANQISCYGVREAPGTAYDYSDHQMALFWDVLFRAVYSAAYSNVDANVLRSMLTNPMQCQDSPTMMAFGTGDRPGRVGVSVRDFARFGLLYLNQGDWNGTRLLSAANAVKAVTEPLPNSIPRTQDQSAEMCSGQRSIGGGNNQTDHKGSYSWLWWVNGTDRNGRKMWPDAPDDVAACLGHANGKRGMCFIPSMGIVMSWNDTRLDQYPGGPPHPLNTALDHLVQGDTGPADSTAPTAPSGLSATPASESQIDLSWSAAGDPESGIAHYIIYRGGQNVGTAATTAFSDQGLAESTAYTYQVSAVNLSGLEGPKSNTASATTAGDNTPPALSSVHASGNPEQVTVVFSEPVEQASAQNPANYGVDNGIAVSGAALQADFVTVILSTGALSTGITYTLTVNNVRDRAQTPNTIAANTQETFTYVDRLDITGTSVSSGKAYVWDTLQAGDSVYIDRGYTFSTVPPEYLGLLYLRTANDDKAGTGASFITFSVNQPVTVYVGYASASVPSWLSGWTNTGDQLVTTDRTLYVFEKDFSAGAVALGGNEAAPSMYTVVVSPSGGPTVESDVAARRGGRLEISAFPNPCRTAAKILLNLTRPSRASIVLYDIKGKVVSEIVKTALAQGRHTVSWNAGNIPSGIYLLRLKTGRTTVSKKLLKMD
jgi:hypothetical protein